MAASRPAGSRKRTAAGHLSGGRRGCALRATLSVRRVDSPTGLRAVDRRRAETMTEPARADRAGGMSTDQPDRMSSGVTGRIVHHVSRTKDRIDASSIGHVQRRFVQADLANQALILAALAFSLLVPVLV